MKNLKRLFFLFICLLLGTFTTAWNIIPVTGKFDTDGVLVVNVGVKSSQVLSITDFAKSVQNGNSGQLVGLYSSDKFALPVVQQPGGNAAYVSLQKGKVTNFSLATQFGSIGLVAHNTLAGANFFHVSVDDKLVLVYGDGHTANYKVKNIVEYQALSPTSPYSQFVDINNPGEQISAADLFTQIYGVSNRLVLQTCISKSGQDSWGRLFVIADPEGSE